MDIIFLDTNSIRNQEANSFFGNIEKYNKISRLVQIVIPSIVIEEIKRQKERHLTSQLDKYKNNYFTKLLNCDLDKDLSSHITVRIEELWNGAIKEIPHTVLFLEQDGKLEEIKNLAIKNIPPFEADKDKGFKDAYIYLTILQFLVSTRESVFLITNDSKLKEAFNENNKVEVISSPDEYFKFRKGYFTEEYFVEQLKNYFDNEAITKDNISDIALSVDGDWALSIDVGDEQYEIIVDFISKEIINDEQK